jgi:hypothetical protein
LSEDAGVIEEFLNMIGRDPIAHHFQSHRMDWPVLANALDWRVFEHSGDAEAATSYGA